ncbi:hypothetical protein GY45DRAFT_1362742 [Cubamyces sp. BRFM 1775]|nr:hypothetical protein GY45DRAFT_1362742 [Cubamyces sp. BRFM 1775]
MKGTTSARSSGRPHPPLLGRPLSRQHRAQLNALFQDDPSSLSASFCQTWATARCIDSATVLDWVHRRSAGMFRVKQETDAPSYPTNLDVNTEPGPGLGVLLSSDSDDVCIKRERAASPILSEPRSKRMRARKEGPASVQSTALDLVRHTRAHHSRPNPACPTCIQSSQPSASSHIHIPSLSPLELSPLSIPSSSPLDSRPLRPLPASHLSPPRPILKSAIHLSAPSPSSARPPRHVRFSQQLYQQVLIPYSPRSLSSEAQAAYSHLDHAQTVPPRHKRKQDAISPSAVPSSSASLSVSSSSLVHTTSPSLVSASDSPSAVATGSRTTSRLSHAGSLLPINDDVVPAYKKRKLSPSPTLDESIAVPPTAWPSMRASVVVPTPSTPSPRLTHSPGSFFSPSFFSSSPVSVSSAEDEVEALLTSSPPTSPCSVPCPNSSVLLCLPTPVRAEIVSPSPTRTYGHSMSTVRYLERRVSVEPESRSERHMPSAPRATPADSRSPDNQSHSMYACSDPDTCPSRATTPLPPPTDIAPRPRTPPYSGPGGGSKPSTPQPARPPRPTTELLGAFASVYAAVDVISADVQGVYKADLHGSTGRMAPIPPRVRTPPGSPDGPPGRGSRPGTPVPGRPVRPSSSCVSVSSPHSEETHLCGPSTQAIALSAHPNHQLVPDVHQTERAPDNSTADIPPPPACPTPPPLGSGDGSHSRRGTPKPVQPPSSSAGDLDAGSKTKGGAKKNKSRKKKEPIEKRAQGSNDAISGLTPSAASAVVKLGEPEAGPIAPPLEVVCTSGEVLKLAEDEDDQPLAIVLARRKGLGVGSAITSVKPEQVEDITAALLSTPGRQRTTRKVRGRARGKGKTEASVLASVKETSDLILVGGTQTVAPKSRRKAQASEQDKKGKEASVKTEQVNAALTPMFVPVKKERKTRVEKAPKGANANIALHEGSVGVAKQIRERKPQSGTVASDDTPCAHSSLRQDETTNPSSSSNITTTLQFRVSFTRTRTRSFPREHPKYEGRMHPPRTFTYLPEHLWALGTDRSFGWDADGFECMELSALPWLAGITQGSVALQAQYAQELTHHDAAGGLARNLEFILPGLGEGVAEEDDVRVQLYADGPLPTSFLNALGKNVCVRRESIQSGTVPTLDAT